MQGLSAEIESGLESIIQGLSLEIRLEEQLKNFKEEYPELVGYTTEIQTKLGKKIKGKVYEVNPTYVTLKIFKKNEKSLLQKVFFRDIKSANASDEETALLSDDKMKPVIESKTMSFTLGKEMLKEWVDSPNAPSKDKVRHYVSELTKGGEKAITFLRRALAHDIDYDDLDPTKVSAAIKCKPLLLKGIFDLDNGIKELKIQLEQDEFELSDKEFKIGYPEKYAKGKFYSKKDYWKDWHNEEEDAIRICPFSTNGEIITIDELNIQLPEVPKDKTQILFHDLPIEEQYWKRQPEPDNITPRNVDHFHDYIMEEYRRRREGIWFMNKGVPTYLTGHHYYTLQWFRMLDDGEYMLYLAAQGDIFYFAEATMRDLRCLGMIFAKSRRTGFTYDMLGIKLNRATGEGNAKFGMTSKSGTDVEEVWAKFSYAFLNLPFWLRPVVKGKEDSTQSLEFTKPSDNSKEAKKSRKSGTVDYLNTIVDWRPTKNDSYDSVKLDMYLGDECFKWLKQAGDYINHLGMVAPTMMPAGRVIGWCALGSTMGSMDKGGEQGVELLEGSKIAERDPKTGKTATGLYRHFLPAQNNMFEFTDKYGHCWVEAPPEGETIYNIYGERIIMGSEEYLKATEEQKRKQSDKALNEQLRTYPRNWSHIFRDDSENSVFNLHKLYEQIDYNHSMDENSLFMVGNFRWENGVQDTKVIFHQDPMGRFKLSWVPSVVDGTEMLMNNVERRGGLCYPLNGDNIRFGCDPYSMSSTHGVGSKGGIHGKTMHLPLDSRVPKNKFVVEYLSRPPKDTMFFEDVIKVIVFYSAPILVESNRPDLLRYMKNRGYRPFAMDRVDRPKERLNDQEREFGGQMMAGKDMIDSHQNVLGAWIEDYVGVYTDEVRNVRPLGEMGDMPFNETLNDWARFDPKKRTKHDATISSGLAIMACNPERYKGKPKDKKQIHIGNLTRKYKVSTGKRIQLK